MSVQPINPESLGAPKGYSNGMLGPPGGRLLCVAGQVGWNDKQQIVADTFVPQFEQALRNIVTVVEAAGGAATDVARLTIYVTDKQAYLNDLKSVGAAYRDVMGKHFPAMSLVEVAGLIELDALVEIEATAVLAPA